MQLGLGDLRYDEKAAAIDPSESRSRQARMFKLIVLATSIASVSCAVRSVPTRPVTMLNLTLPQTALPTGCGLSPASSVIDGNKVTGGLWAGLPISTNPWTGTARPIVASIRSRMDGLPLGPDAPLENAAPPLSAAEAPSVWRRIAAVYRMQSDPQLIVVLALRFAATEKPFYPLSNRRTSEHRVVIGQLHAVVSGTVVGTRRLLRAI